MGATIQIHLRDLSQPLVDAWAREFAGVASVRVSCGDMFSEARGRVADADEADLLR